MPRQRKATNNNYVRSVRLGPELDAIVDARAQAEGITGSELLRNVIHGWAYGESPSADMGYYHARRNATTIAHALIERAKALLPASQEELDTLLEGVYASGFSPNERRRRDP